MAISYPNDISLKTDRYQSVEKFEGSGTGYVAAS